MTDYGRNHDADKTGMTGVRRAAIGAFALVGTPYAFKFVWSPLIDRLPPPLPLAW